MDILQGVKKLAEALLLLSFVSFTASPITQFLGIQQPPVNNTVDTIRFFIIVGFVAIAVAIAAVFGSGYLILTGWRDHKRLPKAIRLMLAFALGALAFSLSGPISTFIPIPFIPTVLMTIMLWGVLRAVSNAFPGPEPETVQVSEAIASARYLVKQVEPASQNIDILESKANGKSWKVYLLSQPSTRKFEVEIDMQNGGVRKWKSA